MSSVKLVIEVKETQRKLTELRLPPTATLEKVKNEIVKTCKNLISKNLHIRKTQCIARIIKAFRNGKEI